MPSDHDASCAVVRQSAHRPEVSRQPAGSPASGVSWYRPVVCNAAGVRSSITFAKADAQSVTTPNCSPWAVRTVVKNRQPPGCRVAGTGTLDDLRLLIDHPAHLPPRPATFGVRLVGEPAVTHLAQSGPGRIHQHPGQPLHPGSLGVREPLDAAPGQDFHFVPVRQQVPQSPAHRQQDTR